MAWGRPLGLLKAWLRSWTHKCWESNPACGVRTTWTQDISPVHWQLRPFPSCRCHVAALLTLKANWFDTLTVKQWEIMINNDVLWFFCDQWGNDLWAASTLLLLWLFDWPPPSLPNHISYISKPNNALILLFLLNIMIIIIFLGNPKQPFSRKTFPKILLKPWIIVSCIYSIVLLAYASVTYMMMMIIITVLSLLLLLLLFLLLYITITVIIIIVIIIIIIIIAEFSSGC